MPVITGAASYPENLVEKMRAAGAKVDALEPCPPTPTIIIFLVSIYRNNSLFLGVGRDDLGPPSFRSMPVYTRRTGLPHPANRRGVGMRPIVSVSGPYTAYRVAAPAISIKEGKAHVDATLCVGCGVCEQLCGVKAFG